MPLDLGVFCPSAPLSMGSDLCVLLIACVISLLPGASAQWKGVKLQSTLCSWGSVVEGELQKGSWEGFSPRSVLKVKVWELGLIGTCSLSPCPLPLGLMDLIAHFKILL